MCVCVLLCYQVMPLFSELLGVRLFAVLGGDRGAARHVDSGAVPQLSDTLQFVDMMVRVFRVVGCAAPALVVGIGGVVG